MVRWDNHVSPLAPCYEGSYKVLKRSLHTHQLQIGNRLEVVSVHRLKPAFTTEGIQKELPTPRGPQKVRTTSLSELGAGAGDQFHSAPATSGAFAKLQI